MYNEVLSLLDRTEQYFNRYERVICYMEALIIKTIILYRIKEISNSRKQTDIIIQVKSYHVIYSRI